MLVIGPPSRPTAAMSAATLAGLTAAALVGFGLYGLLTDPHPLRKILAFNILGSGVFLMFGIIARKGAAAGFAAAIPVPQAMVITGIVVAFSATALAVALLLRLSRRPAVPRSTPMAAGENTRQRSRYLMLAMALALGDHGGGVPARAGHHRALSSACCCRS